MGRKPRCVSSTNVYHVVLKSVNSQVIFEETSDRRFFLHVLKKCKENSNCKILAFTLMDNHVHLLIKTSEEESISTVVQRITNSFVPWYNEKYSREGHLFQGRFFSEPVENERYLLNAFRYILQNPVRAGMTRYVEQYEWSSSASYLGQKDGLTDTDELQDYLSEINDMKAYLNERITADEFRDNVRCCRIKDKEALRIMEGVSGCRSTSEFQALTKEKRN